MILNSYAPYKIFSKPGYPNQVADPLWLILVRKLFCKAIIILNYNSTFTLFLLQSMTLNEAITSVLTILKQVMEEKLSANNVEVVTVTPDKLFHMFTKEELDKVR